MRNLALTAAALPSDCAVPPGGYIPALRGGTG